MPPLKHLKVETQFLQFLLLMNGEFPLPFSLALLVDPSPEFPMIFLRHVTVAFSLLILHQLLIHLLPGLWTFISAGVRRGGGSAPPLFKHLKFETQFLQFLLLMNGEFPLPFSLALLVDPSPEFPMIFLRHVTVAFSLLILHQLLIHLLPGLWTFISAGVRRGGGSAPPLKHLKVETQSLQFLLLIRGEFTVLFSPALLGYPIPEFPMFSRHVTVAFSLLILHQFSIPLEPGDHGSSNIGGCVLSIMCADRVFQAAGLRRRAGGGRYSRY